MGSSSLEQTSTPPGILEVEADRTALLGYRCQSGMYRVVDVDSGQNTLLGRFT